MMDNRALPRVDIGICMGTQLFWVLLGLGVPDLLTRAHLMSSYDSHDHNSSKPAL